MHLRNFPLDKSFLQWEKIFRLTYSFLLNKWFLLLETFFLDVPMDIFHWTKCFYLGKNLYMHLRNFPLDKRFSQWKKPIDSPMDFLYWTNGSYFWKHSFQMHLWKFSVSQNVLIIEKNIQMHIWKCFTSQKVLIKKKIFTCIYGTFHQTKGSCSGEKNLQIHLWTFSIEQIVLFAGNILFICTHRNFPLKK